MTDVKRDLHAVLVTGGKTIPFPIDDKGYCRSLPYGYALRIEGRKFSPGFAENARREMGGDVVPGPHAFMNQHATVIAAHHIPEEVIDAKLGDLIVESGNVWKIARHTMGSRTVSWSCSDALTLLPASKEDGEQARLALEPFVAETAAIVELSVKTGMSSLSWYRTDSGAPTLAFCRAAHEACLDAGVDFDTMEGPARAILAKVNL
jgi:hypothetical protein